MFCRSCGPPWAPGAGRCPECGELHAEAEMRTAGPELPGERNAEPVPPPAPAPEPPQERTRPESLLPGRPSGDDDAAADDVLVALGPWVLAGALALIVIGAAVLTIAFFGSGTGTVAAEPSPTPIELPPTAFAPASGAPDIPRPRSTQSLSGLATPQNLAPTRSPQASSTRQPARSTTPSPGPTSTPGPTSSAAGDVTPALAARLDRWLSASATARAQIRDATGRISCGRDNTTPGKMIAKVISQREAIQRQAASARRGATGRAAALLRAMERAQDTSVTANQAFLAATTDPNDCETHLQDGSRISDGEVSAAKNEFLRLWRPWAMQYDYPIGDRESI